MVFSSITFLFYFLPLALIGYYLAPRRWRNAFLLVASLIFYLWGTGVLAVLLIGSIGLNYVFGEVIDRLVETDRRRVASAVLALAVVANLASLALFKYGNFALAQFSHLLGWLGAAPLPVLNILLPIGISFFTFHALSYLIDVYRGTARHLRAPVDFGLYLAFFPQLIAGPIVRFHEIRDQLLARRESSALFARGILRFGHGLAKKVLIADVVAPLPNAVFATAPQELNAATALLGLVGYAVQLYFDFSGYTDMAIGLAMMVGIRLPENFDRPYAARSITEFWRRWHMSLSRWFRDYLYIPLGGNRGSRRQTYRNLLVTFLLVGLWHGASWTFVAWGAYHGVLLVVERQLGVGSREPTGRALVARVRTIALVLGGWILFRSPAISSAGGFLLALARPGPLLAPVGAVFGTTAQLALVLGVVSVLLPTGWVTGVRLIDDERPLVGVLRLATAVAVIPAAVLVVAASTFTPFLYFRF